VDQYLDSAVLVSAAHFPTPGLILADLGADVIKVERPGGDDTRGWGPPFVDGSGMGFHLERAYLPLRLAPWILRPSTLERRGVLEGLGRSVQRRHLRSLPRAIPRDASRRPRTAEAAGPVAGR
jgi:hypothetical protein